MEVLKNLPGWVNALSALFIIVGVIAAAVAIAWSATAKTRTQVLESTNEALSKRVDWLEKEADRKSAEYKTEKAAAEAEITAMRDKVRVLEKVVTGKEQLDHIQSEIEAHDKRVDTFTLANTAAMSRLEGTIEDIKRLLNVNKRLLSSVLREMAEREQAADDKQQ